MLGRVDRVSGTLAREVGHEQIYRWQIVRWDLIYALQEFAVAENIANLLRDLDVGSSPGAKFFRKSRENLSGREHFTAGTRLQEQSGPRQKNGCQNETRVSGHVQGLSSLLSGIRARSVQGLYATKTALPARQQKSAIPRRREKSPRLFPDPNTAPATRFPRSAGCWPRPRSAQRPLPMRLSCGSIPSENIRT